MEMNIFLQSVALQNKIEELKKLRQRIADGKVQFHFQDQSKELPLKYSEQTRQYVESLLISIDREIEIENAKFKNL